MVYGMVFNDILTVQRSADRAECVPNLCDPKDFTRILLIKFLHIRQHTLQIQSIWIVFYMLCLQAVCVDCTSYIIQFHVRCRDIDSFTNVSRDTRVAKQNEFLIFENTDKVRQTSSSDKNNVTCCPSHQSSRTSIGF